MPLLKNARLGEDAWHHLADDEMVPDGEAVTVTIERWARDRARLVARNGPVGVRLPNDAPVAALADDIDRFGVIVLNFPRFGDGRAYSQARLLRGRLGYWGELRAAGNVLRDQLLFMQRCGFDAFEVGPRAVTENWTAAFGEIDVFYQPTEDGRPWAMRRRAAEIAQK